MKAFEIHWMFTRALAVPFFVLLSQTACAHSPFARGGLYDGSTSLPVEVDAVLQEVGPGDIVIVSESHGFIPHHLHQIEVLEKLKAMGRKVSVGMEFFHRGQQAYVDDFLERRIEESDFLKAIGWGGTPFSSYRRQVEFPLQAGGWTIALNAPRALTSAIAKKGVAGLSREERAQLPADFERGNAGYFERFKQIMGDHVPEPMIEKYFQAQSAWDEIMATEAIAYLERRPEQTLVIIVGDFHAAYGGGLGDRLGKRGKAPKRIISQVNSSEYDDRDLSSAVLPHPRFGPRGDAVWVAR